MSQEQGDKSVKTEGRGSVTARSWQEVTEIVPVDIKSLEAYISRNDNGRRLSRQELEARIKAYFRQRMTIEADAETGKENIRWIQPPTIAGVSMAIGISTKTFRRYVNGNFDGKPYTGESSIVAPEDFDLLRRAFQIVEDFNESRLASNSFGAVFWLKSAENGRWSDNSSAEVRLNVNRDEPIDRAALMEKYKDFERPELPDFNNED